jgi:hypothetical protein
MVAIIRCDRDEAERRDSGREIAARRGQDSTLYINRRKKIWKGGSHLTVLIDRLHGGDYVTSLGWTTKLRNSSADLDLVLEVSRVEEIPSPVQYSDVVDLVPKRFHEYLVHEGTMSEGTGKALVGALIQVRPNLREVIERIEGVARQYPIRDSLAGQTIAMQRDATIGAVRMAGMLGSVFAQWDRPSGPLADDAVPPPYLSRVPRAREDKQIDHDASTMIGWLTDKTPHTSWHKFTGFGQRLYVANANREIPEETLGTDLIYFNATRQSIILVQYKRMDAGKNGFYYPDSDHNLASELERMEAVDKYVADNAGTGHDFRLGPSPSWLKICQPQAFIPQTADMIPGMYFTREHFQRLRDDPRLQGPRGTRFGYANVPSYLDNTMFNRLVETGLIGTAGSSTELLHDQIMLSFEGHKSLVVATLHGDDIPQSKRNTEKRQQLKSA